MTPGPEGHPNIPTKMAWDRLRKAALRYAESERRRGRPEEEE